MKRLILDKDRSIEEKSIDEITSLDKLIEIVNELKSKGVSEIRIIGSGEDGDLSYAYIQPMKEREETDQEYSYRLAYEGREKLRMAASKLQQEQRDKREYKRLKQKFEQK
jgi:hypothetical protein